jgi:hypothetical protein
MSHALRWSASAILLARQQPLHDLVSVCIRGKHGIEDVLDRSIANNQRQTLEKPGGFYLKGRQPHGRSELESRVTEKCKRQVQPPDDLALVISVLGAQAKHTGVQILKVVMVIAERA